jgi:hypothetical protein
MLRIGVMTALAGQRQGNQSGALAVVATTFSGGGGGGGGGGRSAVEETGAEAVAMAVLPLESLYEAVAAGAAATGRPAFVAHLMALASSPFDEIREPTFGSLRALASHGWAAPKMVREFVALFVLYVCLCVCLSVHCLFCLCSCFLVGWLVRSFVCACVRACVRSFARSCIQLACLMSARMTLRRC